MVDEGSWLRNPIKIRAKLREIGQGIVPYAVALAVSGRFRFNVGNVDIMAKGVVGQPANELAAQMAALAVSEVQRIGETLDDEAVKDVVSSEYSRLKQSLESDTDEWKKELPGRPILNKFSTLANLHVGKLKKLYLHKAEDFTSNPFEEIVSIFQDFSTNNN